MEDFSINEMLELQRKLQKRYQDKWEPIGPEAGKNKLLWMIGEIGEVIDIVKKNGDETAVRDADLRAHLVEEMSDVLMYYKITAAELKKVYLEKQERNMKRW